MYIIEDDTMTCGDCKNTFEEGLLIFEKCPYCFSDKVVKVKEFFNFDTRNYK